jgi:hypothetical protein
MPFYCGKRSAPGLFMNTHYSGRSSRPARLFSFGLLDGPQVRLCRPHLREAAAGYGLSRFATAFMNNPGAGPGVVLGPKQSRPPHHLVGAHKMVRLIRHTVRPQRIPSGRSVSCFGVSSVEPRAWGGRVIGYAPGFLSLRPRICQHLLSLVTKDYSDRLLAVVPCHVFAQPSGSIS